MFILLLAALSLYIHFFCGERYMCNLGQNTNFQSLSQVMELHFKTLRGSLGIFLVGLACWYYWENFLIFLGCLYMSRFELLISVIMPFVVFIFF